METLKPLKDAVDQDVKTSGKLIFAKSLKLYPEMKPHLPIDYGKQIYLLISTCTLLIITMVNSGERTYFYCSSFSLLFHL